MIRRNVVGVVFSVLSCAANSYVICGYEGVEKLNSGVVTDDVGLIKGSYIAVDMNLEYCKAHSGEDISGGVRLVVDDLDNKDSASHGIKQFWSSLLLAAQTSGSEVRFHAYQHGADESGRLVVKPYFLSVK